MIVTSGSWKNTSEFEIKDKNKSVDDFRNVYFSIMENKENIWKLQDPEIVKKFDYYDGKVRTIGYSAAKMQSMATLLLRTELPKDLLPQILNNYFSLYLELDMFVERKFLESDSREYFFENERNKENQPRSLNQVVIPEVHRRRSFKSKAQQLFKFGR